MCVRVCARVFVLTVTFVQVALVDIVRLAEEAASGLLHLHKEGVIHRDIGTRCVSVRIHNCDCAMFASTFTCITPKSTFVCCILATRNLLLDESWHVKVWVRLFDFVFQ